MGAGSFSLDAIVAKLARVTAGVQASGFATPVDEHGPAAAVAALLRQGEAGAELFFIRRADRAGDPWSGHIAFPGGRREAADVDLLGTAVRETLEEVGIDLRGAELLGTLPDVPAFLRSKRGGLVVRPFVFAVRGPVHVSPNAAEVAGTMWVPFETFARGEGKETFTLPWEGRELELPCFRLAPHGDILWGLTYRMLETLLEALAVEALSADPDAIAGG